MVKIGKSTVMTPVANENRIPFNVVIGARRTMNE